MEYRDRVLAKNPWLKHYNGQRGYVSCTVTPEAWRADYKTMEYVSKPNGPAQNNASFVVRTGSPAVEKIA